MCMCVYACLHVQAHHFLDLSLGGGLRGIRNRALMGCMSQRATHTWVQGGTEEQNVSQR